ncbi:hypothetical protein CAPTEDRAFT_193888 [Capitella teleta]|uniref:G-protein coupled receptors family 1 profile domain-containing protein n=1 Tax=Capitella teleta TaxID=283909 RepID=R7UYX1_CAPTE|nr:hypothetical protein CAPTEDRAFT_193888 [Capitella teleta]|eukprot:ELU11482.1 hypothetical protein CAPTEDRAFT_193888 [Capitella teleta]
MENSSILSFDNASSRQEMEKFALVQYFCALEVKFYLNTLFAGALCLLGMAGNSLSFIVLNRDRESPVASFLLQSLSLTDNFFLAFWFLHFSINAMFEHFRWVRHFHPTWIFIRVYSYPLVFVGQTAMIWMTVLIAVSRYIAVCVPYKASYICNLPRMKLAAGIVLFMSLLYNIPRYFENTVMRRERNGSVSYIFRQTDLPNDPLYRRVYFDFMYYIFSFVLPLIILAVLNTRLVLAYRLIQKRRQALRGRSTSEGQDNNITLIMIIVIVVFMVCNAPARIFQIVQKYEGNTMCWSAAFVIGEITNILEVLNSSANFIVYCAFRKKFRHILRDTLCECCLLSKSGESLEMTNGQTDPDKKPLTSSYKMNNGRNEATVDTEVEL